ncbi:MAG: OmpH family outer membrane protein [Planctomycetota bacterium]
MNTKRWIAGTVAFLVTSMMLLNQSAMAQTKVAIVDIGKVFKNHPVFSQQLESLKQQADQFKSASIKAQQDLVVKAEGLKRFKAGTPDYIAAEAKLAQESAAMEVEQRNKMRDMMLSEAKLHYDTYQQVAQLIDQYCDTQQIQLVLRYNSEAMDANNPSSVMLRVNSSVIYHNPNNDITDLIIGQLMGQANASPIQQRR